MRRGGAEEGRDVVRRAGDRPAAAWKAGAAVSAAWEADAAASATRETGVAVSETREIGAAVSETRETGAAVSETRETGAAVSATWETDAAASATRETGAAASETVMTARACTEETKNYVYIVECSDGTFYTGWTNNLGRRLVAHNAGNGAKYTRSRRPVTLVCCRAFETKGEAMAEEARIKRLTRAQKVELIAAASDDFDGTEQKM